MLLHMNPRFIQADISNMPEADMTNLLLEWGRALSGETFLL
jgi:hypothetical protein